MRGTSGWGRGGECALGEAFCRCSLSLPGLQPTSGRLRKLACPAIHHFRMMLFRKWMDTRVKPAYDAEYAAVILPFRECQFMQPATREERLDLATLVADLNGLLRLKTTVIGMK